MSLPEQKRIAAMRICPYELHLKQAWITARERIDRRTGFLLRIDTVDGLTGIGDCAPLETAGTESLRLAYQRLNRLVIRAGEYTLADLDAAVTEWGTTPAARCATETAVMDLYARAAGLPLYHWLNGSARASVYANAAVGNLDRNCIDRCLVAAKHGYKVIKLKVATDSIDTEISILMNIFNKLPSNVKVRLDANGGWDPASATAFVTALADAPVESLEEPLRDPDAGQLTRLQSLVPWSIALDESVTQWPRSSLLSSPPVRRVVCKPTVLGGLRESLRFARELQQHGVEAIITTTLESAVGTWACVHLAAALGGTLAHGLTTSDWFEGNAAVPPVVHEGRIALSSAPGLGLPVPSCCNS
jgi:o-succinylbenzoate synthase